MTTAETTPSDETTHRFALTLHYRGDAFHGWQLQAEVPTVQGAIETALKRLTGARRAVLGSGRTDAGVHAIGQVASVLLPVKWSAVELRSAMNAVLPRSIWVAEARRVAQEFHPRFHAIRRSYEYRLGTVPDAASPFKRGTCWPLDPDLNVDPSLLDRGAAAIVGERSFRRFAKTGQPSRGERCRVFDASWRPLSGIGPVFRISADRYLHRMVRYLVGTMVEVANGHRPFDELAEMLSDPDSDFRTSPPAPPEGLFLARVDYPAERWEAREDRDPPTSASPEQDWPDSAVPTI